ncbi:hypothetical protein [Catenulispora sp. GP43]|uniref:hypothetical protein n=1 Tax=Catenulispora sp. GP43 TaxID=3156263 RepID=UPI003518A385
MTQDLPFLLREQAKNRVEEHEAEHVPQVPDTDTDVAEDEDRLEPGPGQLHQEHERLRHAAEMAEKAYRLADDDRAPSR